MTPNDPRHGSHGGYTAGCREDCCRHAQMVYMKLYRMGRRPQHVSSRGTSRRIEALGAIGYSMAAIARELGCTASMVQQLRRTPTVRPATAAAVDAVYRRLCMTPASDKLAGRTRSLAARRGWLPPLAWDDIDRDDAPAAPVSTPPEVDVDELAVQRAFDGDTAVRLNNAERRVFVARWLAAGRPFRTLEDDYGYKVDRYLERGAA